jgi:hypothetical protein
LEVVQTFLLPPENSHLDLRQNDAIYELCSGLAHVSHSITDLLGTDHSLAAEPAKLVQEQIGLNIMYIEC